MFVCSMFWNLVEVVLYLNLTWTLLELCLSWSSGSGVLSVSVLFHGLVCRGVCCFARPFSSRACGLVFFGWTACSRFVVGSFTRRKSNSQNWKVLQRPCNLMQLCCHQRVPGIHQCLFDKGSAKLSYQKLGLITKGSKDNTSEKLLEPVKFRSQGSKLKNI